MRRTLAGLSIAGFSLLAACGSGNTKPAESVSDSSTTVATSTTSVAKDGVDPYPYPTNPSISATVVPDHAKPGDLVRFRVDVAEGSGWSTDVALYLEQDVNGVRRMFWGIAATDYNGYWRRLTSDNPEMEIPAVEVLLPSDLAYPVPDGAWPGEYRACKEVRRSAGEDTQPFFLCAPLTIE